MPAGDVTLTANFMIQDNRIQGQVLAFNQFESPMPSTGNFWVAIDDGQGNRALTQAQMVGDDLADPVAMYYEFLGMIPGQDYTIQIWEDDATVGETWTWNNYGGVTAADALITSYMVSGNPIVENFPWIQPAPAAPYTPFFFDVADVNGTNTLTSLDALLQMYAATGYPGTIPYPGNTFNFQVAGETVGFLGDGVYPQAPSAVAAQFGTYQAAQAGNSVFYQTVVTAGAGTTFFNIYYNASGDVNASYVPQNGSKSMAVLNYQGEVLADVGEEINIPVSIDRNVDLGAITLGINFDNSLLEVTGVEGYDIYAIDQENGTVRLAMADPNTRNFEANNPIVVINARVLAPISTATRYFELENITELVDGYANVLEGYILNTVKIGTDMSTISELGTSLDVNVFPNPFKDVTNIQYTLPEAGKVYLMVYNKVGKLVTTLVDENQIAGEHKVVFRASEATGPGVYMYRIIVEGETKTMTSSGSIILLQ